eukprot:CAMPEP_0175083040 /NCGR_PEP_ID=MMETSP0052_2-20121109/27113_1 /TAXON_ID=51329 ORGANISM="Polytomella parva, Strain SAG 63-3" /NCGR_SAMPLE_ID=MMETSP0052_2 /ASSEMBLY_ACC=CAM_ASM_000194 /LENGTH=58 /DNA_ID=CAMNT_0016354349 /DNA_START=348 /DNA_END=521 /DNA_ORIENTATION=-
MVRSAPFGMKAMPFCTAKYDTKSRNRTLAAAPNDWDDNDDGKYDDNGCFPTAAAAAAA